MYPDAGIYLNFGVDGTGKTYSAVREAYDRWKGGNTVVFSNIALNFPHIRYNDGKSLSKYIEAIVDHHKKFITPFDAPLWYLRELGLERSYDHPLDFFILCDEIQNIFPSREFGDNFKGNDLKNMNLVLTEPRHVNMTFIGVCQVPRMVDVMFRRRAKLWYHFTIPGFTWRKHYDVYSVEDENTFIPLPEFAVDSHNTWHGFETWIDQKRHEGGLYYTKELTGKNHSMRQFFNGDIFTYVNFRYRVGNVRWFLSLLIAYIYRNQFPGKFFPSNELSPLESHDVGGNEGTTENFPEIEDSPSFEKKLLTSWRD